ncbi:F-box protein CPR1-like [Quercus robur]|uniref:F-box protein CPR1-like n=1 Tax=Quercus robur TaxID=38942 RepID=UPI0021624961|nr:F-box protein CPR1-like [Quercus robur]
MSDNINKNLILGSPWEYLPDEIVTDIFLRLPIKSIIICTSVSKTWKSLIQNPTFISNHLHHSYTTTTNNHNLLLISSHNKELYCALHNEDDPYFSKHTRFDCHPALGSSNGLLYLVGTCNGLLCLSNTYDINRFFLLNPSGRKFVELPLPNVTLHNYFEPSLGFGYDSKTNDYKVVRAVSLKLMEDSCVFQNPQPPVVEVYSLSTGQWKMLSAPVCVVLYGNCQKQAFVNGALHWLASRITTTNDGKNKVHFVLVLDLGDEVFHEILLPESLQYDLCTSVSVYGNSIAMFQSDSYDCILNIWVMKEYGVASSWMKVHQNRTLSILRAVGFRRNGEVVLQMFSGGRLVSWNPESQKIKELRIIGFSFTFVGYYVENLVLLDKTANGAVTYRRKSEASVVELMKSTNGVLFWDVSFFRGVRTRELEAMSGFMDTIYGSSVRGFGKDKMCWKPDIDKGFMVKDYYSI